MARARKYLERFEYICRECDKKGTVLDVLLNPEVLLIRGYCPICNKRGLYKAVDMAALREEHDALAQEEAQSSAKKVRWKWSLLTGRDKTPNR